MDYCVQCGEKLSKDEKFCTSCGTEVVQAKEKQHEEKQEEQFGTKDHSKVQTTEQKKTAKSTRQSHKETSKTSRKRKFLLWFVLVLALLLFGVHKGLQHYFDPMRDLMAIDQAIMEKDLDTFYDYVRLDEEAIFDEESYFEFIEFQWSEGMKDEYYDIIEWDKREFNPLTTDLHTMEYNPHIKVHKQPILFGLYYSHDLQALPTSLSIESPFANTKFELAEETIDIEDGEYTIEKIYPGLYDIKATAENEYGTFTYDESKNLINDPTQTLVIDFPMDHFDVYTNHSFRDAVLYVNGKSTKKTFHELSSVGPLPLDGDVTFHAVWKNEDGEEFTSNKIKVDEDFDHWELYFEFDLKNRLTLKDSDDQDEEVGQYILDFRSAYENAVNYVDYSYIADYLKKGSAAEKGLKQFVKDMKSGSYYYNFTENEVTKVKKDGKNKFSVTTNEKFEFIDDDGKMYDYDRVKVYHVEVVDDEYQIVKIDYKDTNKEIVN